MANADKLSEWDRSGVLTFDGMKIRATVTFDSNARRVIGFEEFNGLAAAELEFDQLIGKANPQLAEHVLVFWFQTFAAEEHRQSWAVVSRTVHCVVRCSPSTSSLRNHARCPLPLPPIRRTFM